MVKKRRKSRRTRTEIEQRANAKKTLEPTETGGTEMENMI
jgi:hypothetical protein